MCSCVQYSRQQTGSVNRCLESDGITSPARHIPRHTNAGSCGYLSIAGRKEMLIRSTRSASAAQASYSRISALSTRAHLEDLHSSLPHVLASARLTLPPPLYSLCVCWCWVACYAPLAAWIHPPHPTFRPQIDLILHSSNSPQATPMPKKKGGKVQGRAKQKAKAQNVHHAGGKPAWMKKFAKSFDDGPSLLPCHRIHMPISHTLPRLPALQHLQLTVC